MLLSSCSSSASVTDAEVLDHQVLEDAQLEDAQLEDAQVLDLEVTEDAGRRCSGLQPCPWGFVCVLEVTDAGEVLPGVCEAM